jgi:hypothetical protein
VNKHGLINVLGYKMADLPEWAQRIWAMDNVGPDGGLSEELHMSQNLAKPASTIAPEVRLWRNLNMLQKACVARFGQGLFLKLPSEIAFFKRIHRFHGDSLDSLCELCKELNRTVTEQIDLGALNAKFDPANAEAANKQRLRQIRRLALWMDTLGQDGRSITRVLAGVSELRQGDAHEAGSGLKDSPALLDIPADAKDYVLMGFSIIGSVANCLARVGMSIAPKGEKAGSGLGE